MTPSLHGSDEPLVAIADAVRELTEPARHAERFSRYDEARRVHLPSKLHWTRHPSLLDQLRAAETAGRGGDAGGTSGGYESRPAAQLAAIERLCAIEQAVDDWLVRRIGMDTRTTIEDNLRALVGAAGSLTARDQADLLRETQRWLTWARVVTGWDSEPWRPRAACPMCERHGGLRVRLDERVAACLDCGETWDGSTIALLADHLRGLNEEAAGTRRARAQVEADLTNHFPRRGPCLICGHSREPGYGQDARHRLIDAVVEAVLAGDRPADVALDHELDTEAVLVAVAWATHPDHAADLTAETGATA